ncbi:1,4-alpha-glucan branching protein GlgB [Sphingomonas morindae]
MFEEWRADPFAFLGPHEGLVRSFQPGADGVDAIRPDGAVLSPLREVSPGLFEGPVAGDYRLRIRWPGAVQDTDDPYRFGPLLGDTDIYLFNEGRHWQLADKMGASPDVIEGVAGVRFAVWAPNARAVSVIGGFNGWDGRRHPMRLRHGSGIWELFIPGLGAGEVYKYEVIGADGVRREKADPLARATEMPPATGSIVAPPLTHGWGDADWMAGRAERHHAGAPISVYEVHAASWKRPWDGAGAHDWDELATMLIPYVQEMGFTHVELMPIMEHPFGGSWGYQPLGQFAPSARFGTAEGFARLVDRLHQAEIGVLLDWVPAHFPTDAHGLALFDGTHLYEHADPREGFHQDWNTLIYNLGRTEVAGFLIASGLWWLERFHVDGLRVDAVASMLYRDYSRREGEWIPNIHGGRENLESIAFLQRLNEVVRERAPGAITVAEESTSFPGVTRPVAEGGLGFDYKWNMGWMNDTLRFMERDPLYRPWHGADIGFGLVYAFSERFILPLSHDEVVHGKGALIEKMPGDPWQRHANLRALYSLMWMHPGKKLLFMGGEIAQRREWSHDRQLDWELLQEEGPAGVQRLLADLNRLYRSEGALHHSDADSRGFRWLIEGGDHGSIFAFVRQSAYGAAPLIVAVNMLPTVIERVVLGAPAAGRWAEIFNSDAALYGGGNIGNAGTVVTTGDAAQGFDQSLAVTLPPLGAILLRYEGTDA